MSGSGQSVTTVLALVLALGLIVGVPFVTLTARVDNVTQANAQLIVEETIQEVTNTGMLTRAMYQNLENRLAATGNTYNIEIEIHHLDENPGKKTAQANYTKIGENVYYIEYKSQVLPQLGIKVGEETSSSSNDRILLKEGDKIYIGVTNESPTANQTLNSSLFNISNQDDDVISASSSGMVKVNGTAN